MSSHLVALAVAGLIRRGNEILLIQQQGPSDPHPNWALPGGVVDAGEMLIDALAREIREETGLVVEDPGWLLYTAHKAGDTTPWTAFVFEIGAWSGDLHPDDPDGLILDARFMPIAEGIAKLEALPWRGMREPIVSYLRNEQLAGALWCYHEESNGEVALVRCIGP